jgi:hypothetical protein
MNTAKTVEAILNKEDRAVNHIIDQNVALQKTIDDMKNELVETNNEKNDLEQENDGLTKSKNILQGYMKNMHEMNKIERKLKRNYNTLYSNFKRYFYIEVLNTLMFYILMLNVPNQLFQIASYIMYASILVGFTFHVSKQKNTVISDNSKLIKELSILVKATDMVNDLLDSL